MAQLAYPKDRIKFLLLENVSSKAVEKLNEAGYTQIEHLDKALPKEDLMKKIEEVHVVGLRSKTKLTRQVLEKANKLLAIGAFCIGTDQIDLEYAAEEAGPCSTPRTAAHAL
jgi:Phosphoglycerate dehydrogenase and related dehydrogenases